MNILLTNDDGIDAIGIKELAFALYKEHKVFIVAPSSPQSAKGHALTLHKPLRVDSFNFYDTDIEAYKVSGTTVDCIIIGLDEIIKEKVSVVISGINDTENLGDDVPYSGTVAGAHEAYVSGVSSIALSVQEGVKENFEIAIQVLKKILKLKEELDSIRWKIERIFDIPLNGSFFLNVNIPNIPASQIKGIKITRAGRRRYKDRVTKFFDPSGKPFYWITGKPFEIDDKETDVDAIMNGYISITPLSIDLTDYEFLKALKGLEDALNKEI